VIDKAEDSLQARVLAQLSASAEVKRAMADQCLHSIIASAMIIASTLRAGKTIFFCGNGGSAADSQHLATELVVRLSAERNRPPLSAIALTTDTSTLTACANDFGFEQIFSRQVEALGREGDVLVCISTSGNSVNVVKAAESAKAKGMKTIAFLGATLGKLGNLVNMAVNIPADDCGRIQEGHITAGHIIIALAECLLYDGVSA
jgi:D-sedoheptulose 7-phosphate isomerase